MTMNSGSAVPAITGPTTTSNCFIVAPSVNHFSRFKILAPCTKSQAGYQDQLAKIWQGATLTSNPLVATSLTRGASAECEKHNVRYALTSHDISTTNCAFSGRRQQGSLGNANLNRNETARIEWDIFANHWSQAVEIHGLHQRAYMGRRPATFYIPVNDSRMNYTYGGVEITAQFGTSSFKIENGRTWTSVDGDLECNRGAIVKIINTLKSIWNKQQIVTSKTVLTWRMLVFAFAAALRSIFLTACSALLTSCQFYISDWLKVLDHQLHFLMCSIYSWTVFKSYSSTRARNRELPLLLAAIWALISDSTSLKFLHPEQPGYLEGSSTMTR